MSDYLSVVRLGALRQSVEAAFYSSSHRPKGGKLTPVILFTVSIAAAVLRCRGHFFYLGYDYSAQALDILGGAGLSTHLNEPPLYALLIAPLIALGLVGPVAGVMVSLAAFGVSTVLCYWLTLRLGGGRGPAIFAALWFIFLLYDLEFAAALNPESLYIGCTLGALLGLDLWLESAAARDSFAWHKVLTTALLISLPVWVRYAGISIFLSSLAVCVGVALMWPQQRFQAVAIAVLSGIIFGLLLLRNSIYADSLSGHPLGVTPAENPFSATIKLFYLIGLSWIEPLGYGVTWPWKVGTACFIVFIVAGAGWAMRQQPRVLLVLFFALAQLVVLAGAASITRIDELSPRFVMPTFALFTVVAGAVWSRYLAASPVQLRLYGFVLGIIVFIGTQVAALALHSFHWSYLKSPLNPSALLRSGVWAAVACLVVLAAPVSSAWFMRKLHLPGLNGWTWLKPTDLASEVRRSLVLFASGVVLLSHAFFPAAKVMIAQTDGDISRWSPATIHWLCQHEPKGSMMLVNHEGGQLPAVTRDYRIHLIPSLNPANGGYDEAYGVQQWTRLDFLRFAVANRIQTAVFFLGRKYEDPMLRYQAYGDYIPQLLLKGALPEVSGLTATADGLIVHLVPFDELARILDEQQGIRTSVGKRD